jgi:hypothetical protein
MANVRVFWFGKTLLKSPRTGIRPNGTTTYDERIAKELVKDSGDLLMVTTLDQRKVLHLGKKIDPEYIVFKYPSLKEVVEKAAGIKIITTVSDVIKHIASEPLTLMDEIQQRQLHQFLEMGKPEDTAPEGNTDPVTTDQESTGAEAKVEDTVVEKPKRGRPKKVADSTPSADTQ